jgi:hypothetical protein
MSPDSVAHDRPVLDLGMDSLMDMELGMAVEESFSVKLSIMAIAEGATMHTLAERIVDMLDESAGDGTQAASNDASDEIAALAARHALDEDEARALLERNRDNASHTHDQQGGSHVSSRRRTRSKTARRLAGERRYARAAARTVRAWPAHRPTRELAHSAGRVGADRGQAARHRVPASEERS